MERYGVSQAHVVTIGGGTGSFTLLSAFKHYFPNLSAIVTMADDGGSTGQLRDELGVLPPGDIRQCLVALSDDEQSRVLRQLFNFRFSEGTLAGHSFGNLFLSAMEKMTSSMDDAILLASEILKMRGRIIPITNDNVRLAIQWGDEIVRGEGAIDVMDFGERQQTKPRLFLEPAATISPSAADAIRYANLIVVAPGDIYTSIGALLVVDGVREALARSTAPVVYVSNLTVNPRQTKGWTTIQHAEELERLVGAPFIDYVIYNTAKLPANAVRRYMADGELPVAIGLQPGKRPRFELIGADVISKEVPQAAAGDKLATHRSYIRHDGDKVSQLLLDLLRA